MELEEFQRRGHELVDWIVDYYQEIESRPVTPRVAPGDVIKRLPSSPPSRGESFDRIFGDFLETVLPGMTHWQHPRMFAYFPSNNSYPSILGELVSAALAANCMSWQTAPAATELEERVMEWVREIVGLPPGFAGVIQDTASTATLCALLAAREQASGWKTNLQGLFEEKPFVVYASAESHSSVEKDVRIAGIGSKFLRKIPVDTAFAVRPELLEKAIQEDVRKQLRPLAIVATLGTTSSTGIDPLRDLARICKGYKLWFHVDAAYAGTALVLPEIRGMADGIEEADSFLFNPHKWMLTNFDCTAFFVRDKATLIRTLQMLPEYLRTTQGDQVNNYRDWGIQLGRRFRALKLWFVIRSYGVEGIQKMLRHHIEMAKQFAGWIDEATDFERLAPVPFSTVCFRYRPQGINKGEELDGINERLLQGLNQTGKVFLSHTRLNGIYTLRLSIGQWRTEERHVAEAWQLIRATASGLLTSPSGQRTQRSGSSGQRQRP